MSAASARGGAGGGGLQRAPLPSSRPQASKPGRLRSLAQLLEAGGLQGLFAPQEDGALQGFDGTLNALPWGAREVLTREQLQRTADMLRVATAHSYLPPPPAAAAWGGALEGAQEPVFEAGGELEELVAREEGARDATMV